MRSWGAPRRRMSRLFWTAADSRADRNLRAPRHDKNNQSDDRNTTAVINPLRRTDHEAFGRIRKIARPLAHEDKASQQQNHTGDDQQRFDWKCPPPSFALNLIEVAAP